MELAAVHALRGATTGGNLDHLDVVQAIELGKLQRVDRGEDVEVAREEGGLGRHLVGDDARLPGVDVGAVLDEPVVRRGVLVVVGPALHARARRVPLGERVGAAARTGGQRLHAFHILDCPVRVLVGALELAVLLHHPRVQERVVVARAVDGGIRVGAVPVLRHRQLVRRIEAVDEGVAGAGGVRAVERAVELLQAAEAEGDGLGVHGIAVVELHAGADAPDEGGGVDLLEADHAVHGEEVLGGLVGVGLRHRRVDDLGVGHVEHTGVESRILCRLPILEGTAALGRVGIHGRFGRGLGRGLGRCLRRRRGIVVIIIVAAAGEDGGGAGGGHTAADQEAPPAQRPATKPLPVVLVVTHTRPFPRFGMRGSYARAFR